VRCLHVMMRIYDSPCDVLGMLWMREESEMGFLTEHALGATGMDDVLQHHPPMSCSYCR
jgi:hypothetical protein